MSSTPLFDALRCAGFRPRDPEQPSSPGSLYFPSHGKRGERLGTERLRFAGDEAHVVASMHLDHREDWLLAPAPRLRTALITWHIHGCVSPDGEATVPHGDGYGGGWTPLNAPWAWCRGSWYWPGAIVGVTWSPHVTSQVSAAIEPFVVQKWS